MGWAVPAVVSCEPSNCHTGREVIRFKRGKVAGAACSVNVLSPGDSAAPACEEVEAKTWWEVEVSRILGGTVIYTHTGSIRSVSPTSPRSHRITYAMNAILIDRVFRVNGSKDCIKILRPPVPYLCRAVRHGRDRNDGDESVELHERRTPKDHGVLYETMCKLCFKRQARSLP